MQNQRFFKTVSQSVLIIKACLSYCMLVFQDVFQSSTSVHIVVLIRSCFGNFEIDFKIVIGAGLIYQLKKVSNLGSGIKMVVKNLSHFSLSANITHSILNLWFATSTLRANVSFFRAKIAGFHEPFLKSSFPIEKNLACFPYCSCIFVFQDVFHSSTSVLS